MATNNRVKWSLASEDAFPGTWEACQWCSENAQGPVVVKAHPYAGQPYTTLIRVQPRTLPVKVYREHSTWVWDYGVQDGPPVRPYEPLKAFRRL